MSGLIDVHSHHYPDSYLDACRRPDSGFTYYTRQDGRLIVLQDGAVGLAVPQPLPPLEHRIEMMDAAGVDIQVLSVSAPNVFRFPESLRIPLTRDLNDEFSELAGTAGGRLRVFASIPLPSIDAALEELDRALALPHMVGRRRVLQHRPHQPRRRAVHARVGGALAPRDDGLLPPHRGLLHRRPPRVRDGARHGVHGGHDVRGRAGWRTRERSTGSRGSGGSSPTSAGRSRSSCRATTTTTVSSPSARRRSTGRRRRSCATSTTTP